MMNDEFSDQRSALSDHHSPLSAHHSSLSAPPASASRVLKLTLPAAERPPRTVDEAACSLYAAEELVLRAIDIYDKVTRLNAEKLAADRVLDSRKKIKSRLDAFTMPGECIINDRPFPENMLLPELLNC